MEVGRADGVFGNGRGRTQCRLPQRKRGSKEPRHLGNGLWQPAHASRAGTLRSDQEIWSQIPRKKLRGPMPGSYSLVLGLVVTVLGSFGFVDQRIVSTGVPLATQIALVVW